MSLDAGPGFLKGSVCDLQSFAYGNVDMAKLLPDADLFEVSPTALARSGSSVVSVHGAYSGGGFSSNLWYPKPSTKAWRRAFDTSLATSIPDWGKNAMPLS
jgi:hypothetical protein